MIIAFELIFLCSCTSCWKISFMNILLINFLLLQPASNQQLPLHSYITPESSPKSTNVEDESQEMMIS